MLAIAFFKNTSLHISEIPYHNSCFKEKLVHYVPRLQYYKTGKNTMITVDSVLSDDNESDKICLVEDVRKY